MKYCHQNHFKIKLISSFKIICTLPFRFEVIPITKSNFEIEVAINIEIKPSFGENITLTIFK